jgi:hypothetical protein
MAIHKFWIIYFSSICAVIPLLFYLVRGPDSSVDIATDNGLDGPGIESRWGRNFQPVQTGPGAHPASCTMCTRSFLRVKLGRGVLLTTHPLLAPRSWKSSYNSTSIWATTGPVTGLLLYLVPDIIEIFISWDDTFHFRLTEIRFIYHQTLCHKYFHLPISFKFGSIAANARYACAADNVSMRAVPKFHLHNFLSDRPNSLYIFFALISNQKNITTPFPMN